MVSVRRDTAELNNAFISSVFPLFATYAEGDFFCHFAVLTYFLMDSCLILIYNTYSISMNILLWIGLGLMAGGIASRFLDDTLEETLLDIFLGVVAAILSGFLMYKINATNSSIDMIQIFTVVLASIVLFGIRNNITKLRSS
jgi:uncharacterized membrane protein YeaQ/YmgE (transglycosylase-associated protein family)